MMYFSLPHQYNPVSHPLIGIHAYRLARKQGKYAQRRWIISSKSHSSWLTGTRTSAEAFFLHTYFEILIIV